MRSVEFKKTLKIVCISILKNCDITKYFTWHFIEIKAERELISTDTTVDKITVIARFKLKSRNLSKLSSDFGTYILTGRKKFSWLRNLFFLKKPSFKSKILKYIEFVYFFGSINNHQKSEPRKNFSCILATYIRTVYGV